MGTRNGSFTATDATLKQLVGMAYDLRDHQISGGPKGVDSDTYSIEAKPDSATPIPPRSGGLAADDGDAPATSGGTLQARHSP
jgi:uncharacterized protein (TIGR03435 family)